MGEKVEYYGHTCACGCGGRIEIRKRHKYNGVPKFIKHHNARLTGKEHSTYRHGKSYCSKYLKEYSHKHYVENKAKYRALNEEWKKDNKDKVIEYSTKYRKENKDKLKQLSRIHYLKNKDKIDAQSKKWVLNNKDKRKQIANNWTKRNNEYVKLRGFLQRSYISIKKNDIPEELYKLYELYSNANREISNEKSKFQNN